LLTQNIGPQAFNFRAADREWGMGGRGRATGLICPGPQMGPCQKEIEILQ